MPKLGFELEADEIIPNLWQGSFPRLLSASECGFEVVVMCARELMLHREDRDEYQMHGVRIIEAPFDDSLWPTENELTTARWAAVKVASAHNQGKKVLVTCHAGLNRSGLVNALALRDIRKIPGSEAVKLVRAGRENALINHSFSTYVYNLK